MIAKFDLLRIGAALIFQGLALVMLIWLFRDLSRYSPARDTHVFEWFHADRSKIIDDATKINLSGTHS